jgi:hypothetical protein
MKKYLSIAIGAYLAFTFTSCSEQAATEADAVQTETAAPAKETKPAATPAAVEATGNAKMAFENSTWNFGTIKQGDVATNVFKFENTGSEPLIITKAKGSCGCTAPNWPKEPIAPGETGEIEVKFNSRGKKGSQNKTVTIWANTTPNQTRLRVTGEVDAPVKVNAPVDASANTSKVNTTSKKTSSKPKSVKKAAQKKVNETQQKVGASKTLNK